MRDKISQYFKAAGIAINMKYIDPSYIIRSVPANSDDSLLCDAMARHAVHAAMAGKTDVLIGHGARAVPAHPDLHGGRAEEASFAPERVLAAGDRVDRPAGVG